MRPCWQISDDRKLIVGFMLAQNTKPLALKLVFGCRCL